MILRDALLEDLPAIAAIYAHHVRSGTGSFEEEPPGVEIMIERWRAVTNRNLPWLVAEVDGAIAGYAYARPIMSAPPIASRWKTRSMSPPAQRAAGWAGRCSQTCSTVAPATAIGK